ncbi:MAG: DMT family transporter [bacterium]
MPNKLKYAIVLALGTALISGTNTFLTKTAVTAVSDPVVFTFLKNTVVALILIGLIALTSRRHELKNLSRRDITKLLAIGAIGGSLPFILFFTGLTLVPAVTAGFIHKTLFIWVALLAVPFLKERIGNLQLAALALLLGGNLASFGLPKLTLGTGELMILAATILWAMENIIAKKALAGLSSPLVASARMAIGSLIILVIIVTQGKTALLFNLSTFQWIWTLITSLLLTGYVLTWYTALKAAPATLVASLLVPATLVTNILTAIFVTHTFPTTQLISGTFLALGVTFIISRANKISPAHGRRRPLLSLFPRS